MAIQLLPAAMAAYSGAKAWGSESDETNKANQAIAQEHNTNVKNFLKEAVAYKLRGVRADRGLDQLTIQKSLMGSNLSAKLAAVRKTSLAGIQKEAIKSISSAKEQTLGGSRTAFRKGSLEGLRKRHKYSHAYTRAVEETAPFLAQQNKRVTEDAESRLYASIGALPPQPEDPKFLKDDLFTRLTRTATTAATSYATGQTSLDAGGSLEFLPDALKDLKIG